MHFVITATDPAEGALRYFCRDGFKANLLHAVRFKSEKEAQRRSEQSIHCRRMIESGGRVEVRRVASVA